MKKVLFLSALIAAFTACKQESQPAPDQPAGTPADTTKVDTLAAVNTQKGELLAMNFESGEVRAYGAYQQPQYASFGKKITADKALTNAQMLKKYKALKTGDTINVKFKSTVTSVCKKKGCWMKMTLPESKEAFVKFKDYEFFVPLNADNTPGIVSGKAFLDVVSVAELKHYAKDGGKSQEEIDKIKEPKVTYAFTADGVLLQK